MSPSNGLQLFTNCPSVGPTHGVQSFRNRLLQCRSPWGHKTCQQTCSSVGSSLHRSTGPGRSLLQHGLPTESQLPSGIYLLRRGVPPTGYRCISALWWTSMGSRGTACLTMVLITGCKGSLSVPASRAPPLPCFFIDLGVCRVLSLISLLSPTGVSPQFFPSLS